ncbi:L-type lectin-domain containing receptor kinase IX.1-like [Cryptomeria japonica]|uniref:L-type lectin-domain containing receptor kinase IX.1-like n=1 Tax=Cryptomeria japonica TaxID=3369 RepID=UPI0027DA67D8|nr:L-type lectin-domain containing receptor kinase IX.1-like [Cryptomeria japonica]
MAKLFSFFFLFFFCGTFQLRTNGWSELNFTCPAWTNVLLQGIALPASLGDIQYVSLTPSLFISTSESGFATYNKIVPLWNNSDSYHPLANFTTHFSFSQTVGIVSRAGIVFFMASSDLKPPVNATGLFNQTSHGNFSNHIVAVGFDSFINHFEFVDNIVKINVNNVVCMVNISANNPCVDDGVRCDAWIDYDGVAKKLQVFLACLKNSSRIFALKPTIPILSYKIDLTQILPQNVTVGFSASTDFYSVMAHDIYSWEFSSLYSWEIHTQSKIPAYQTNRRSNAILSFIIACVAVVVITMVGLALLLTQWRHGNTNKLKSRELDKQFAQGPRKFSYAVLRAATKNFSNEQMLGKGGFGQVYRGILSPSKENVAVKRISQCSKQGQKEYISEVSIISKLRHRNLVQLHGWCHEKGRLLLVYEFLPNGSLDKYLFGEQSKGDLNWDLRYSIACDIASALLYLHEEWDQRVVHRDIKASNVMLDAQFKAKLGDFGLARVVERERGVSDTTVVAGTFGYLAPECVVTRKASLESDVFSFGAVCLEIACGRRAVDRSLDDHNWRLVEWVWDLYGKGKILDAADAKLGGNFYGDDMETVLLVGLLCSHPDPKARLSIRQVVDILKMKAPLPLLPLTYPETVYTTSHGPVFALSFIYDGTFRTAESSWNIESA